MLFSIWLKIDNIQTNIMHFSLIGLLLLCNSINLTAKYNVASYRLSSDALLLHTCLFYFYCILNEHRVNWDYMLNPILSYSVSLSFPSICLCLCLCNYIFLDYFHQSSTKMFFSFSSNHNMNHVEMIKKVRLLT